MILVKIQQRLIILITNTWISSTITPILMKFSRKHLFNMNWYKKSIVSEFFKMIPDFDYEDKGKYLDGKM